MTSPDLSLPRRGLLVAGLSTTAAFAGCDVLPGTDETGPGDAVSTTEPAVDDDSTLTKQTARKLAEAAALAGAVASRFPALAEVAVPFRNLHRSHGKLLGGLPDVDRTPVKPQQAQALAGLLTREEHLQRHLVTAAMQAESGALAQTFAVMAAAVAQHRLAAR